MVDYHSPDTIFWPWHKWMYPKAQVMWIPGFLPPLFENLTQAEKESPQMHEKTLADLRNHLTYEYYIRVPRPQTAKPLHRSGSPKLRRNRRTRNISKLLWSQSYSFALKVENKKSPIYRWYIYILYIYRWCCQLETFIHSGFPSQPCAKKPEGIAGHWNLQWDEYHAAAGRETDGNRTPGSWQWGHFFMWRIRYPAW